jgi:hypothetical protein
MSIVWEFVAIWFIGLGIALMLQYSPQYVRGTKAWLLWPFALVLRLAKRCLQALVSAFGRWLIRNARDW